MRHLFNYILMLLALVISIYLGLRIAQPEVVGHWHVSQTLGSDEHGMQGVHHFTVYTNGKVYTTGDMQGDRILVGKMNRALHCLEIDYGCLTECYYYHVSGNRMEITGGGNYGPAWKVVAFRTEAGDCDVERDFFAGLPLKIRLPQFGYNLIDELPISYRDFSFYIGEGKLVQEVSMLADRFREVDDQATLQEHIDRHDYKLPPNAFPYPRKIIVYQDAEVDASKQLDLLQRQFGEIHGFKGYYQVYRQMDAPGLEFDYRFIPFGE